MWEKVTATEGMCFKVGGRSYKPRNTSTSRSYKKQGSGFSLRTARRNASLLTLGFKPNEVDFGLLTTKTVR